MKHMSAMQHDGISFGMDVDGKQARSVINKAVKKKTENGFTRRYIDYRLVGSLMKDSHWLVTERKDFKYVWFDYDVSDKYYVSYEEAMA